MGKRKKDDDEPAASVDAGLGTDVSAGTEGGSVSPADELPAQPAGTADAGELLQAGSAAGDDADAQPAAPLDGPAVPLAAQGEAEGVTDGQAQSAAIEDILRKLWDSPCYIATSVAGHAWDYAIYGFGGGKVYPNLPPRAPGEGSFVFDLAVAFILANRDAPPEAIPIHLQLANMGFKAKGTPVETLLWSIFRFVFLAVFDHVSAERAALQPAKPAPAGGWPGERAMEPAPAPFSPTGFSARL